MALPEIVSREDWLAARPRLLALQKEQTARISALNAERRRMPMVRIEKKYVFEGPDGPVTLAALSGDRSQLVVQHVMFQPEWDAACPGCTASLDVIPERLLDQVHSRDTSFVAVSRAALAKLEAYKAAPGLGGAVVLLSRQRLQLRLPRYAGQVQGVGAVQLPRPVRQARG